MRSFMDDLRLRRVPGGRDGGAAWSRSWAFRHDAGSDRILVRGDLPPIEPLLVATAAEVVLRAGRPPARAVRDRCTGRQEGCRSISSREVDLDIERWFRRLDRRAVPGAHACWPRSSTRSQAGHTGRARGLLLGVRPDRRHGQLRARTAHLLRVAGARGRRNVPTIGAVYDPMREELFTAERGAGARLNGVAAARVSRAPTLVDSMLCTGFPYDVHETVDEVVGLFGAFVAEAQRGTAAGLRGARPLLRGSRPVRRLLGAAAAPVGRRRRRAHRDRGRGRGHRVARRAVRLARRVRSSRRTEECTKRWLTTIRGRSLQRTG